MSYRASDGRRVPFPEPDWSHFAVKSRAQDSTGLSHSPLGDPIRWGGQMVTPLAAPALGSEDTFSEQFLRVQASDTYPRSWALLGTLRMPAAVWSVPPLGTTFARLEVTQGVGQSTVVQELDLRLLTDIGLQVYSPRFSGPGDIFESRAFAAIGGIIGNAVSVRMHYILFAAAPGWPGEAVCDCILTPFAAGTGL